MTTITTPAPDRIETTVTTAVAARIEGGTKIYGEGDTEVRALDDVTGGFAQSAFTAIMGPSGSGKSTLMHCMAGLDHLTSGQVFSPRPGGSERLRSLPARCTLGVVDPRPVVGRCFGNWMP